MQAKSAANEAFSLWASPVADRAQRLLE